MRKTRKKLPLHRETILYLTKASLAEARGLSNHCDICSCPPDSDCRSCVNTASAECQ